MTNTKEPTMKIPSLKINVDTSAATEAIDGLMRTARLIGFLADLSTEVLEPAENDHPTKREHAIQMMASSIRSLLDLTEEELAEPAYAIDRERLPSDLHGDVVRGDRLVICEKGGGKADGYAVNNVIVVDSVMARCGRPDLVFFTDSHGDSCSIYSTRLTRWRG